MEGKLVFIKVVLMYLMYLYYIGLLRILIQLN